MKKILLASSALVAGAAFAAPAMAADGEIVWSAFTQFHVASQESDNGTAAGDGKDINNGLDFNTNSEIHLNAQTTADNGLTYGLHIELEADQNGDNNTDENDIWVSGDFGKVVLGDNDSAGDNLKVNASSVGFTYGMFANYTGSVSPASNARTGTGFADAGDNTKITYFTPTFNGFKAGISYAPDSDEGASVTVNNSTGSGRFDNHVDGGVNYSGSFNDFTVDAGIGGGTHEVQQAGGSDHTYYGVSGGVKVGYAGFSAAVSYSHEDQEDEFETDTVDLGLGYATGPWGFVVGASFSDRDNEGATDNESHAYSAGVNYEIAPGLSTWVGGTVGDYEGGAGDFTNIQTGLAVSF